MQKRVAIRTVSHIFRAGYEYPQKNHPRLGSSSLLPSRTFHHPIPHDYTTSRRQQEMTTTAYTGLPGNGKLGIDSNAIISSYLPIRTFLPHERTPTTLVEIDTFRNEQEIQYGMMLMNQVIRDGRTWPFEEEFSSMNAFQAYFLSHAAFVVRPIIAKESLSSTTATIHTATSTSTSIPTILGCFYIKPNFPGRCSHICNGGFITNPTYRRKGVGTVMGKAFLKIAKDLGYKSSYFNLVFESNVGSIRLWESLGFERVATLKKAARLLRENENAVETRKAMGDGSNPNMNYQKDDNIFWDTAFGYRYDLEQLKADDIVFPKAM